MVGRHRQRRAAEDVAPVLDAFHRGVKRVQRQVAPRPLQHVDQAEAGRSVAGLAQVIDVDAEASACSLVGERTHRRARIVGIAIERRRHRIEPFRRFRRAPRRRRSNRSRTGRRRSTFQPILCAVCRMMIVSFTIVPMQTRSQPASWSLATCALKSVSVGLCAGGAAQLQAHRLDLRHDAGDARPCRSRCPDTSTPMTFLPFVSAKYFTQARI